MLSSDKNVETIAQLVEIIKHYLGLQKEYLKLDIIDKIVRLLTFAALVVVFSVLLVAVLMYLSFAIAFWLASYMGTALAFLVVGGIHLLLIIIVFIYRKKWIEKPLVRFLANLLLEN
ncbi:MAG: phage holin family protein [Prevotella sp.]|jgi:hypothetical protein|nr:phage holin family protein [Prevotella sp.]